MQFFLKYYLYIIFLTWSAVDTLTGIYLRYDLPPFNHISLGVVIRLPFLIFVIITSFYYSKPNNLIFLIFTVLIFFILTAKSAIIEGSLYYIQTLIKFISIIFFIPIYTYLRSIDFLNDRRVKRIINYNLIVICTNILLSLFGIGFSKYGTTDGGYIIGSSGFFYAGNELNTAVVMLFSCWLLYGSKDKMSFFKKFFCFIVIAFLSLSKTLLLGVLLVGYCFWSSYYKTNRILILIVFTIFFVPIGYYLIKIPTLSAYIDGIMFFYDRYDNFFDFISSGRYSRILSFQESNFFSNISYMFWGTVKPGYPEYTFEMDFVELIFYNGFLGILLLSLFWIQVRTQYINLVDNASRSFFLKIFVLYNVIAFAAGHTFASQMALPYLLLILIYPMHKTKVVYDVMTITNTNHN